MAVTDPTPMSRAAVVANAIGLPLGLIALVFLPVGWLDWKPGWIFIAFLVAAFAGSTLIVARVNPSIFRARSRFQPGTKRWDLEKFRSISRIACVPKIILGLTSSEITRERSDPAAQAGNCSLRHLTQIGLELAKRHLDRVQIRGILRQITKDGATRFNRFAHAAALCAGRLSMTTVSLRRRVGAKWCST